MAKCKVEDLYITSNNNILYYYTCTRVAGYAKHGHIKTCDGKLK